MAEVLATSRRFMADPSLLLPLEGLRWLEADPDARAQLVIPWTFSDLMGEATDISWSEMLEPEDYQANDFAPRMEQLSTMLDAVPRFSHRATVLAPPLEEVLSSLLLEPNPMGDLRADEWAFLQSQSVLVSKLRRPLEAFRDAAR